MVMVLYQIGRRHFVAFGAARHSLSTEPPSTNNNMLPTASNNVNLYIFMCCVRTVHVFVKQRYVVDPKR